MEKRLGIRLIGALTVAIAIFAGQYLSSLLLKAILAVVAGALFLFIDPLLEYMDKQSKIRDKLVVVRNNIIPINKFLKKFIGSEVSVDELSKKIIDEDIAYNKVDIIHKAVDAIVRNDTARDATIICALCNSVKNEADSTTIALYKKAISDILEKYSFPEFGTNEKTILNYYYNFSRDKGLKTATDELDYKAIFRDFTKQYNPSMNLAFNLFLEKGQAEEFRKTLAILVGRGRLNLRLLGKDVLNKINKELEIKQKTAQAYLVLSNKFYAIPKVEKVLDSFPGIKFGKKWGNKLPDGVNYVHMRLIYPPDNYKNANQFLNREIVPHIPERNRANGFISIIPVEGTEIFSFPSKKEDISSEKIRESYDSLTSIKTGLPLSISSILIDTIDREIPIDNLLSILPFNIFVPDISDRGKRFIIDNYDTLKGQFDIHTLDAWADVNAGDLGDKLIALDSQNSKRIFKDERWKEISTRIVSEAHRHRDARIG
jgi:hypothetical protein